MENEQRQRRGRSDSRASSTSSSLEVRCACQYYLSDSLLPERSALAACRPAAKPTAKRMVQTPPAGRRPPVTCGDHDYEPIGQPIMRLAVSQHSVVVRSIAPVVKITDTDVVPVADSDDSIDDRYRFHGALILDGDVILPLDGRIEDDAMDGRNLGDQAVDSSADELESPQELQERIEQRFFNNANEERNGIDLIVPPPTGAKVETASTNDEEPRPGIQQRLKSQAGKIRSHFKNIQKPTFKIPKSRAKATAATKPTATEKQRPTTPVHQTAPPSPRGVQKASRMERFRMALPERPRFSLPDKSKFHLPDRSKFHLKKPNIQLPKSLTRPRRTPSQRSSSATQSGELDEPVGATETKPGGPQRRTIFDFSTLPRPRRLFERNKDKQVARSEEEEEKKPSPNESRARSIESSTFPRAKKTSRLSLSARWAQRFGETVRGFHGEDGAKESAIDRSQPWRHPSLEEPRLSLQPQVSEEEEEEEEDVEEKLPWENTDRRSHAEGDSAVVPHREEEIIYADEEDIKEHVLKGHKEPVRDPRLEDEQLMSRIGPEEPKKKVRLVEEEDDESIVDPEAEDENQTYHPRALYDGSFQPVDPPDFHDERAHSAGLSEEEEDDDRSSMRSDREIQQSSGSSCDRRRRGVIEEIDSDEFFLREKGISEENVRFHLMSEIRNALRRPEDKDKVESAPPERPERKRSARKRTDASSTESFERAGSLSSRHRVVYHTQSSSRERDEPLVLDNGLGQTVRPARRKSRGSLGSNHRLPIDELNIVLAPIHSPVEAPVRSFEAPVAPSRRKRLRRDQQSSSLSIRTVDSAMYNGFGHSHERIPPTPPPTPPAYRHMRNGLDAVRQQQLLQLAPVPPKRTRSRTASLAPEDDRTSREAESLPGDFGFVDEDVGPPVPRDSSSREPSLPGYAVIEKREKPPRPPPPRRKKPLLQDKFATAPRPAKGAGPRRPLRNYSTLRTAKSDTIRSSDSMPFIDGDFSLDDDEDDELFHRELQSGEVLSKIQGRPLPAPPRPPRHRRPASAQQRPSDFRQGSLPREMTPDFSETVASTQTDPLPDDLVIEEEVTTAKLVVTPSRSGSSQVLISAERNSSPASGSYRSAATPPIPPLPASTGEAGDSRRAADTESTRHRADEPPSEEPIRRFDPSQLEILRSALFSTDEPLRIPSLEVGDLRVERLTVSQLEAYKVAASEIDAIVVSATEMSSRGETDTGIHPSLLQELIAIRSQLEAVTAAQSRPQSAMEDAYTATSNERVDIPIDEQRKSSVGSRRPVSRESSPLLVVQPMVSEREAATVTLARAAFPPSSSATDLSTADSTTLSDTTTIEVTTEVIESVVTEVREEIDEKTEKSVSSSENKKPAEDAVGSRSSSPSPSQHRPGVVRQTASPVKSLPPVISVTPDGITTPASCTLENTPLRHVTSSGAQPQRAVISYRSSSNNNITEDHSAVTGTAARAPSLSSSSRETSQSPPPPPQSSPTPGRNSSSRSPPPPMNPQFIAFPTSHIPPEFFALANPPLTATTNQQPAQHHPQHLHNSHHHRAEPSVADSAGELLRALRHAGNRSLRHFVDSVVSRFGAGGPDDDDDDGTAESSQKLRRVELALCALLVLVACLIALCVCTPRTVTHHHHWDYFNPPQ
ncbi:serine/arginine repetitive matrix protein 2 isoform X2 [Copidosoma floridanum]|uniref:serine/arginine repetitive matrix protein 2 isoform X2 n=1 Tax=Copidosoma floridanum TaxID=29053 RepID=UPI0006C9C0B3|nr:serine/arginine repetitive matrix protein 2 isoform X2 [Copidosoma floridanum]